MAAVAVAAVVAVLAPAAAHATPSTPQGQPDAGSYTPPPIEWGPCTAANSGPEAENLQNHGARCGYLTVPLDYAHPAGPTIQLAVSRILHWTTSPADYQGVMLVNPGGPGGSGIGYSQIGQDWVPNNAGAGYDWIGFDPRGIGNSIPALSCDTDVQTDVQPPYRPTTPTIMSEWVSLSKDYAADCRTAKDHALFDHVKTIDNVRDMDSLRKALGQSQINFDGMSYGTYLGMVYMTMFPGRVRRVLLDSSVDPRTVWYAGDLSQVPVLQRNLDVYFDWLAKYHDVYHLGSNHDQVRDTFLATEASLDKHPAEGVFGGDDLLTLFDFAAAGVYIWEDDASAFSSYVRTGDATALLALWQYVAGPATTSDNGYAIYLGTLCSDAPWPRDQAQLNRTTWSLDQSYPYFAWFIAWQDGPCAYWPFASSQPVTVSGQNVHVPILMIDETFDPETPYEGSLYVRSIFPTASLIEGRNGTTHAGQLSGVPCSDDTIANYLLSGTVPVRQSGNRSDKVCPPVPQPDPTQNSSIESADVTTTTTAAALRTSTAAQLLEP